jgi:hypothetical protein
LPPAVEVTDSDELPALLLAVLAQPFKMIPAPVNAAAPSNARRLIRSISRFDIS